MYSTCCNENITGIITTVFKLSFISNHWFSVENACNIHRYDIISAFDFNDTDDCDISVNVIILSILQQRKLNIHNF